MTKQIEFHICENTEDPYENIDKKYKVGEFYSGTVTKLWITVASLK